VFGRLPTSRWLAIVVAAGLATTAVPGADYTISGRTSCEALGGSWFYDGWGWGWGWRCAFLTLTVDAGDTLRIHAPVKLYDTFFNHGQIINESRLRLAEQSVNEATGRITNNGLVEPRGLPEAEIHNHGGIINNHELVLEEFVNESGGLLQNEVAGRLLLIGALNSAGGTIDNGGEAEVLPDESGTGLVNESEILNTGTIRSISYWNVRQKEWVFSEIENHGTIDNEPAGTIVNAPGSVLSNRDPAGTIDNAGLIVNRHRLDNNAVILNGGVIDNHGKMRNDAAGTIDNNGAIHNRGTPGALLENHGALENNGGTITNETSPDGPAVIINQSDFSNDLSGTIENHGVISSGGNIVNAAPGGFDNQATLCFCDGGNLVGQPVAGNPPIPDGNLDGDLCCDACDVKSDEGGAWARPSHIPQEIVAYMRKHARTSELHWPPPAVLGGTAIDYELVGVDYSPVGFDGPLAACYPTQATESGGYAPLSAPLLDGTRYYLVLAANVGARGPAGLDSGGNPRVVRSCP